MKKHKLDGYTPRETLVAAIGQAATVPEMNAAWQAFFTKAGPLAVWGHDKTFWLSGARNLAAAAQTGLGGSDAYEALQLFGQVILHAPFFDSRLNPVEHDELVQTTLDLYQACSGRFPDLEQETRTVRAFMLEAAFKANSALAPLLKKGITDSLCQPVEPQSAATVLKPSHLALA